MKRILFLSGLIVFLFPNLVFSQTAWTAYEYNVSFKIKNAGITVNGKFSGLKSEILFSSDKLATSKIKASVDAGTLATGINLRDYHIKGEKYLDADKFKLLEGSSTKLYFKDNDYAGMFNITIKGVTKEVDIPFQFNQLGDLAEFKGEFTLNRRDFEVGGSSMTMGDNVTVRTAALTSMTDVSIHTGGSSTVEIICSIMSISWFNGHSIKADHALDGCRPGSGPTRTPGRGSRTPMPYKLKDVSAPAADRSAP